MRFKGYTVLEEIYRGSNTIIYRGIKNKDTSKVILKFLRDAHPNPKDIARLRYEYSINRKLNIDGVVKAYGIEEHEGKTALVLEDFGGKSLEEYIRNSTFMLEDFLAVAVKVAETLGEIHKMNLIHKDITPNNILMNPETRVVKITDFGISTMLSSEYHTIEKNENIEGTIPYISPEQTGRMNWKIDYRTDFYSLGITFYKMLTGVLPFQYEDEMQLIYCHLAKQPAAACDVCKDIPRTVSEIIMKLIEKDPEKRYQSAFGLKHDLERCLKELKSNGAISLFALGQKDVSDVFLIPQKLYGRENELNQLKQAFQMVRNGAARLVLVRGYPGIGKSSLVNEIRKTILESKGYFISGKFEQYKRNIPYHAFIQAFNSLISQILSESEDNIILWRNKLLSAIGKNGNVIIDVIPELALVIGTQPEIAELPPAEAQNRFIITFQNFIAACTSSVHPLVIFLDDLQWADLPSIKLIRTILNDDRLRNILIIGAYRDNETDGKHPLLSLLDDVENSDGRIIEIALSSLGLESVNRLICETMHTAFDQTMPLARICIDKTEGNPFFLIQFLKSLYKDNYIWFDKDRLAWDFHIERISGLHKTENVVQLMEERISGLSEHTQHILRLAACIGNPFSLKILSIISASDLKVTECLWEAIDEELISPLGNEYKYLNEYNCTETKYETVEYKFLHDRIHQAVYASIDNSIREELHLKIGNIILEEIKSGKAGQIFNAVNHINLGSRLICDSQELLNVINVNLLAGRKAKETVAFRPAYSYFSIGLELMGNDGWERDYPLALSLHLEAIETACMLSEFTEMEKLAEVICKYAKSLVDKAKVYEVQVLAYTMQGSFQKAVNKGIESIKQFGVKVPANPSTVNIFAEYLKTWLVVLTKGTQRLAQIPIMENKEMLALSQIIGRVITATYTYQPSQNHFMVLTFTIVRLSIKFGINPVTSGVGFGCYGVFLCGAIENIVAGYKMGKITISLADKFEFPILKARATFVYYTFISHWKESVRSCLEPLAASYQSLLDIGDFEFAGYCLGCYTFPAFYAGIELEVLKKRFSAHVLCCKQISQMTTFYISGLYLRTVQNLMAEADTPVGVPRDCFNEDAILKKFKSMNYSLGIFSLYLNKMMVCYLLEEYQEASSYIQQAEASQTSAISLVHIPVLHFYGSLIRISLIDEQAPEARKDFERNISKSLKKMEKWARFAPMNYLHKFYLMKAEWYRVRKKDNKAGDYYDLAIQHAKENKFVQEAALANELAAKFYFGKNKQQIASAYLKDAYYGYLNWGAVVKLKQLEKKYPQVFAEKYGGKRELSIDSSGSFIRTSDGLDVHSIIKATQTISGEIVMEELLKKLVKIMLENAGAQKVLFLLKKNDDFYIEARGNIETENIHIMESIWLSDFMEQIPMSIVNYVNRTKKSVVLDHGESSEHMFHDAYFIKNKVKSVLCMPIISHGDLKGMLYLENNSLVGAFTEERVRILHILSSQLAISLENADLYKNVEALVTERTKELSHTLDSLKKAQEHLIESEKMAALGQLIAGIAHEINTPLGAIKASTSNISNCFEKSIDPLMELPRLLTEEQQKLFLSLIRRSIESREAFSSIEERKLKKKFISELKGYSVKDVETMVDILADMGIYSGIEMYLPLLKDERSPLILNTAYSFSGLARNNRNIAFATDKVAKIVFALKSYAHYDNKAQLVKADIKSGIETVLTLYHNKSKHRVEVVKNYSDIPETLCYPDELNQVWTNIIHNALQAMDYKGRLEISVSLEGENIAVKITDSGKGIPPEIKDRIFLPFFTTKPQGEGTGLGLDIVRKIIDRHNGSISFESVPGCTAFKILLPVCH